MSSLSASDLSLLSHVVAVLLVACVATLALCHFRSPPDPDPSQHPTPKTQHPRAANAGETSPRSEESQ